MKKIFSLLVFSLILFTSSFALAFSSFLTVDEMPDGAKFLPLPPQITDPEFTFDKIRYEWGKSIRNTPRGQMAIDDNNTSSNYFFKIYSEPLGITISRENTPEIATFLNRVLATANIAINKAKSLIMRTRPFMRFSEPSAVPHEENTLRNNSSYPSGHSTMGWTLALVLAEINPDNQNEILKRGFEYGQSRVIIGVHYQSDVDAARLISSALVNRLHANEEFVQQLQKAKEEFLNKKSLAN